MNKMFENKIWAVIGATDNIEKFGYKIYKKLKKNDYKVFPINPNCSNIEGEKCYASITDLPMVPDAINMIVSPKRGKSVILEAARLGIKNVWFQPGTTDQEIIKSAQDNGMNVVCGCVLIELDG